MEEMNIYEELTIPMYCTYKELINAYKVYLQRSIMRIRKEQREQNNSISQNPWLDEHKDIDSFKKTTDEMYIGLTPEQKETLSNYIAKQMYISFIKDEREKISQHLRSYNLNTLDMQKGEEQKKIYDSTHATPYAILGINSATIKNWGLPSVEKISRLKSQYPEHVQEIDEAFKEIARLNPVEAKDKIVSEKSRTSEQSKTNTVHDVEQEKNESKKPKKGFKNFLKRFIAPALVVIGLIPATQKLPEAKSQDPEEPMQKQSETNNYNDSLNPDIPKEFLDDNSASIHENSPEYLKTYGTISFKNVLEAQSAEKTPTQTTNPSTQEYTSKTTSTEQQQYDIFSGLKSKIANDQELYKIVEKSLDDVAVDGRYDATAQEKLDYISSEMGRKNVDVILSSYYGTGAIKNELLDLVDNVIIYYMEAETGKKDIILRFEKDGEPTFIDKSGRNYIATTSDRIAYVSDSKIGTKNSMNNQVRSMLKDSKYLRDKHFRSNDYGIDYELIRMEQMLKGLNNIGDKEMINSRRDYER